MWCGDEKSYYACVFATRNIGPPVTSRRRSFVAPAWSMETRAILVVRLRVARVVMVMSSALSVTVVTYSCMVGPPRSIVPTMVLTPFPALLTNIVLGAGSVLKVLGVPFLTMARPQVVNPLWPPRTSV